MYVCVYVRITRAHGHITHISTTESRGTNVYVYNNSVDTREKKGTPVRVRVSLKKDAEKREHARSFIYIPYFTHINIHVAEDHRFLFTDSRTLIADLNEVVIRCTSPSRDRFIKSFNHGSCRAARGYARFA